ncbi:MAG: hypothetical protein WC755_09235 [Candidatus Woesearchaeota archaeon]|jgi:hypothetical protein
MLIIKTINGMKSNNKLELIEKVKTKGIKYPLENKFWFLFYNFILILLYILVGALLWGFSVFAYVSILTLKTNIYAGLIILFFTLFGILTLIFLELLLVNKLVRKIHVITYILKLSAHEKNETKFNYYWKHINEEIHFLAQKSNNKDYVRILKGIEIYLKTFEGVMTFEDKKDIVNLILKETEQEKIDDLLKLITTINISLEKKHNTEMTIIKDYLCIKYDFESFDLFKFIFVASKGMKERLFIIINEYPNLPFVLITLVAILLSTMFPEFKIFAEWILSVII